MSANDPDDWIAREIDWIGVPLAEKFLSQITREKGKAFLVSGDYDYYIRIAVRDTHGLDDKNALPFFAVKQRIAAARQATYLASISANSARQFRTFSIKSTGT